MKFEIFLTNKEKSLEILINHHHGVYILWLLEIKRR